MDIVSRQEHKQDGGPLKSLSLLTQSRLSVAPLTEGKHLLGFETKNYWVSLQEFLSNILAQVTKRKIATYSVSVLKSRGQGWNIDFYQQWRMEYVSHAS